MPNRPAIASMSIGQPWVHHLPEKLQQAAAHGFQGIELFYDDLDCLAQTDFSGNLEAAARRVRQLCNALGLEIISLQPFGFYEGLVDRAEHDRIIAVKLPRWFTLARILDTHIIQVPANFLPAHRTTGDMAVLVADLRRIADLGLQQSPVVRFVYEALCWSTHVDTWEASWEVVRRVDRPNFGLCLDTFNIAGRVYADPAAPTGKTPNADADMAASIARLLATVDVEKIFYVQIVDGERLAAPLDESHEWFVPDQPSRMTWSRNARLFAFEEDRGGYLPVLDVAKAFFDLGFEGWVSLELFSRTLADPSSRTPSVHARRGFESWKKLVRALALNTTPSPVQHRL